MVEKRNEYIVCQLYIMITIRQTSGRKYDNIDFYQGWNYCNSNTLIKWGI